MDDMGFIRNVVQNCYDDWKQLEYEYIEPYLKEKGILTSRQISNLDALSTDFRKNEYLFNDIAPTFARSNFMGLIDIINIDYPHVGKKLEEACMSEERKRKKKSQDTATNSVSVSSASLSVENEDVEPNATNLGLSELQNNSTVFMQDIRITGNECQEDLKKYITTSQSQLTGANAFKFPQISIDDATGKKVPYTQLSAGEVPSTNNSVTVNRAIHPSPSVSSSDRIYSMNTVPRGVAFIINNVEFEKFGKRQGSYEDKGELSKMFKSLGWQVTSKDDLSGKRMDEYLRKFSQNERLNSVSAMAVVILTHGMDDIFFGIDGVLLSENKPRPETFMSKVELMRIFSSKNCRALRGKPKWFILQACRGGDEDLNASSIKLKPQVLPTPSSSLSHDSPHSSIEKDDELLQEDTRIPETGDMCFLFSSSKGYKAYRKKYGGSPFIKTLTEKICEHSHNMEFCDIMREIIFKFSKEPLHGGKMTLPDFSTQLTHKWYLNPPSITPALAQ